MAVCRAQASCSIARCAYDVFLSFRVEDTGKTFTDHLYMALVQAGFHTFRDDDHDEIERGEYIESEFQKAIEQSRISIVVFSKTYAASTWCLDELVKILHSAKTYGQQILPVFYDMDPSQVRKQTGSFAEAFTRHEKKFEAKTDERNREWMKKMNHWRAALKDVSDLAGLVLQNQSNGYEAKFIQKIVKVIGDKLNCRILSTTPFLIGMHQRVENINLWLQDGMMDVGVITICGMGGIGKTTIAKFVYNLNREKFDGCSFLANIRERSQEPNGLVKLQQQLLSDIGNAKKLSCVDEGIFQIANVICCKRLLLVLDDVDQVDQLNAVFGMRHLFSPGSKIIITTRHERLLNPHEVHKVHQVAHLNYEESLELFSWHAFGQAYPIEDYLDCSIGVVNRCGGLPLALEVLGSSLSSQSLNVWESALRKLKAIPDSQILRKLMISYDSLQDDHDKELFLHIACFFVGRDRDWTIKILDECDFFTTIGIQNLTDRCLLTVNVSNELTMHQLVQAMGREIVRQEAPKEPGERSRLWHHNDSFNVLREKTGTNSIEGLILDMQIFEEETLKESFLPDFGNSLKCGFSQFSWHPVNTSLRNSSTSKFVEIDAFSKMCKLKLLQLNYVQITGCFKDFPKRLRWLSWHGFPFRTIPSDFPTESLVALDVRYSKLKQVWKGTKLFKILKILDLSHSHELTETLDFSRVPNLKRLILEDCVNLVKIHKSIGKLEGLILLDLKGCKNLKKLPRNICMLKSVETLDISGCSNLDWWSIDLRTMGSLKVFRADGIPTNHSTSKEILSWQPNILSWLSKPKKSPKTSFFRLPCSLVKLSIAGCNLFDDDFPLDLSNLSLLRFLDLSANQICSLPKSIGDLIGLKTLTIDSCKRLTSATGISNVRLMHFRVFDCPSLEKISYQSILCGPLYLFCYDCYNLVEVEGHFKLETMNGVDIKRLKTWGFLNIESVVRYWSITFGSTKKLSLQKLYQSGVYSYFLPGDKIPSGFSIRSEGWSPLSFIVPSLDHYKVRGLVVCCVYTARESGSRVLYTVLKHKKKYVECVHTPTCFGVPKPNEGMTWISHWNFGDMLDGGDEVEVSVDTRFGTPGEKLGITYEVKEFGILLLYEHQEEMGNYEEYEAAIQENFPYWDVVPRQRNWQSQEIINRLDLGGWDVARPKRDIYGNPLHQNFFKCWLYT